MDTMVEPAVQSSRAGFKPCLYEVFDGWTPLDMAQVCSSAFATRGYGTTKNGAHKRGRRTLNPGYEAGVLVLLLI